MDVEVFYKRRGKLFDRQQSFFFFPLVVHFQSKCVIEPTDLLEVSM